MHSSAARREPKLQRDPLDFLEDLIAVEVPRRIAKESVEHYTYGRMDRSMRSGDVHIRRCYDNSWRCFEHCRPVNEEKEAERILSAFALCRMHLHVVMNDEQQAVQRFVKAQNRNYVSVPTGTHLAVLTDVSLGEDTYPVSDREYLVRSVVMKVRWDGMNLSSTQGFLPPARKPKESDRWEAHHPSTGRRCGHTHTDREDAATCASETGVELDGSPNGWYVRSTTEWKALGTVRMTTLRDLAASAEDCGLRVTVHEPDDYEPNGSLDIEAVEWNDQRFVRFRDENRYAMSPTAEDWWRESAIRMGNWAIDHRGRITGTRAGGQQWTQIGARSF